MEEKYIFKNIELGVTNERNSKKLHLTMSFWIENYWFQNINTSLINEIKVRISKILKDRELLKEEISPLEVNVDFSERRIKISYPMTYIINSFHPFVILRNLQDVYELISEFWTFDFSVSEWNDEIFEDSDELPIFDEYENIPNLQRLLNDKKSKKISYLILKFLFSQKMSVKTDDIYDFLTSQWITIKKPTLAVTLSRLYFDAQEYGICIKKEHGLYGIFIWN